MQIISDGLKKLGLVVESHQLDKLAAYLNLIHKWNKSYNLTAIKDIPKMQVLHILDSASCYPYIKGSNVLDVGTGAGLPGMVLAILNQDFNITLVDSNAKKIRFLRQCKLELKIDNISLVHSRVEDLDSLQEFDTVVSRAFTSFDDFVNNCSKFLATNGILVSMKGKWNESTQYEVMVNQVFVPFLEAQRHIITYKK